MALTPKITEAPTFFHFSGSKCSSFPKVKASAGNYNISPISLISFYTYSGVLPIGPPLPDFI